MDSCPFDPRKSALLGSLLNVAQSTFGLQLATQSLSGACFQLMWYLTKPIQEFPRKIAVAVCAPITLIYNARLQSGARRG